MKDAEKVKAVERKLDGKKRKWAVKLIRWGTDVEAETREEARELAQRMYGDWYGSTYRVELKEIK
jgi:hypothetical protein